MKNRGNARKKENEEKENVGEINEVDADERKIKDSEYERELKRTKLLLCWG